MSIFSNPQTSEPCNNIGHTIDSKSLAWISIGKSRFLALINIDNRALRPWSNCFFIALANVLLKFIYTPK